MKKTLLLLLLVTLFLTGFSQVCTPLAATGLPGLSPFTENLTCVERGVFYDEVIFLENFTGVNTPNGLITITYLRIDSLTNLPCGITWEPNDPDTTYLSGQTGCLRVSGTTFDNAGQYKLGIYITVEGNVPPFGVLTFSGEASDLVTTLESLTGSSFGINFNYWTRVTELGITCAALDTTPSGNNLLSSCNQVCVSNPPTGIPGLTPSTENLPCIERGVYYDEVISLENFDSINIPTPPISAIIVFLKIDSITNVPCGIGWETNKPDNTLGQGETGCIRVTGTTTDNPGQYKLRMYFTIGGVVPVLGPDTLIISGEASEILDSIQTLFGVSIGISLDYWLRITDQGVACVALDTSSSASNLTACSGSSLLSVSVSGNNTICKGDSTQLTANAAGGNSPYSYIWSSGNGTTVSVNVSPASTSTYSLTVTDATPSTLVTSYTVTVLNKPTANFSVTTNGQVASFNNSSSSNTLQVSWDFGDGSSSSSIAPPVHTYASDTIYTITLIASNDCGADTFSRTIDLTTIPFGINSINMGGAFSLYPNPSSGIIAIQSDNAEHGLHKIKLFDVRGREVYSAEILNTATTFNHSLDLKYLPKGIYTMHLASEKGAFSGKVALY